MPLPVGLVYDPAGRTVLDPDTGVQQAIRHVFTLFARTGSARAVLQQFNADGLLFPVRVGTGARKGELAWMPLTHWRVLRTLHNPRYAGAFAYGRRRERLAANGKKTFDTLPREQWIALITDTTPATSAGRPTRPTSGCCWPTRPRTAMTAPPARPARAPRCSRAWPSAGAAGAA